MNKYTKVSFVENQPIVADWLFSGIQNAGVLPLLIPPGMRAISVPVDEVSDIAGFVLPHAFVDVLVTASGANGKPLTKIVLQNVEVLAIAQDIEQINNKPQVVHVVTMLVTPDQAERLALASGQGGLRLALRNYDDKKIVAVNGVTVAQLLGAPASAAPTEVAQHVVYAAPPRVRPQPKPVSVEVMRNGTTTESISFVKTGSGRGASMRSAPSLPQPVPAAPAKEATPPAAESSKADGAGNFASARAAMPMGSLTGAGFPVSGSASADSSSDGLNAAAAAEPGSSRSAAATSEPSEGATGSSYGGPMSKTIDVP